MAGRRSRRAFARFRKGNRDLIWVTSLIEASFLESTPLDVVTVVTPADWSQTVAFDRCTLLGVRGWFAHAQAAAATAAEATYYAAAMYVTQTSIATSMDPTSAADYINHDVLWTYGSALVANTGTSPPWPPSMFEVKTKRRLSSEQDIRIACAMVADTAAAPRVNVAGCVRALLQVN